MNRMSDPCPNCGCARELQFEGKRYCFQCYKVKIKITNRNIILCMVIVSLIFMLGSL